MKKWLGTAVVVLIANGASANQEQPGAADFLACQEAVKKNDFDGVIASCEKALSGQRETSTPVTTTSATPTARRRTTTSAVRTSRPSSARSGATPTPRTMVGQLESRGRALYRPGKLPDECDPAADQSGLRKAERYPGSVLPGNHLRCGTARTPRPSEPFRRSFSSTRRSTVPSITRDGSTSTAQDFPKAGERLEKYLELKPDDTFAADAHFMVGSMAVRSAGGAEPTPEASGQGEDSPRAVPHRQARRSTVGAGTLHPWQPRRRRGRQRRGQGPLREVSASSSRTGAQAEEIKKFLADLAAAESGN